MLKAHLVFALRTLSRQRAFALINILGLSIGLTAFTLIALYVHFEFSYDRFYQNADLIYRINTTVSLEGETIKHESSSYAGIVHALREDYPGVESLTVVSVFDSEGTLIGFTNNKQGRRVALEHYKGCYAESGPRYHVFASLVSSKRAERKERSLYSSQGTGRFSVFCGEHSHDSGSRFLSAIDVHAKPGFGNRYWPGSRDQSA